MSQGEYSDGDVTAGHTPIVRRAPDMVPGGMIAVVPIGHDGSAASALEPLEAELAQSLPPARRDAFIAGRVALRAALRAVDPAMSRGALLRTSRGGPKVPAGISASVSHKRARAIALAAPLRDAHVGVDLEARPGDDARLADWNAPRSLARRILTAREFDAIADLDALAHREATLLRFALKEAVYKAIDPFVQRHVRFTEVELRVEHETSHGGVAAVQLLTPEMAREPLMVQSAWWLDEGWIVAIAVSRHATLP